MQKRSSKEHSREAKDEGGLLLMGGSRISTVTTPAADTSRVTSHTALASTAREPSEPNRLGSGSNLEEAPPANEANTEEPVGPHSEEESDRDASEETAPDATLNSALQHAKPISEEH